MPPTPPTVPTLANHTSTPPMLPMLARHPCKHATHAIHASMSPTNFVSQTKLDSSFPTGRFNLPGFRAPYTKDLSAKSGGLRVYVLLNYLITCITC